MIPQAMARAEQHLRQGELAEAEALCRQALIEDPNQVDALHLLGLIAQRCGSLGAAIDLLTQAVTLRAAAPLVLANLGEMCRMAGRTDDAIAYGRRALQLQPENPAALSNVGIALFDRGAFDEAIAHYDLALALQPDFAAAHSNRGNALQRLRRLAEAETAYRRALQLQPEFVDAWNNLGACLRDMGRLDEAQAAYRRALELSPNNPETLDNLALALKAAGKPDAAAEVIGRALQLAPNVSSLRLHAASIFLDGGDLARAAELIGQAIQLSSASADAWNIKGRIEFERGDLAGSLASYQRAIELNPDGADVFNNMGVTLAHMGRLEAALGAYARALTLDPSLAYVYVNLADLKRFAPGDAHLAAMETLAAEPGLPPADRVQLQFALAKAYADLEQVDRSFSQLTRANAARRASIVYDERAALSLFDRIEAAATPEAIQACVGAEPSAKPIFILGMPRSGTSLVEQIIASHPMVFGAGELQLFNSIFGAFVGPDGRRLHYPDYLPQLAGDPLRSLAQQYVETLTRMAPEAARITDKMPSNFFYVGLIHKVFPNAAIIHTVRNPVDTCLSCYSKPFTVEHEYTYDLGELGRYYRRYEALMAHWRQVLPPGRLLEVHYEDVVADIEGQARRLIDHCGLEWDDRCLVFHKTDRPVRTASAQQVRQPIYSSSVGRWRPYEAHLGPLLEALGTNKL